MKRAPKLCRHRGRNLGYVRLGGRQIYLGPWGDSETEAAYRRVLAEWAGGAPGGGHAARQVTVVEVVSAFLCWARRYYSRSEYQRCVAALRPVAELYGRTIAEEFGQTALKAVRQSLVEQRYALATVRAYQRIIVRAWRWAAEEGLVSTDAHARLAVVRGLRAGRSEAHEPEPRQPIPREQIDAVVAEVSGSVAGLIRLQLATAARPGEVVGRLRLADMDRSQSVWTLRLAAHKTRHHGHGRTLFFGPYAQAQLLRAAEGDEERLLFAPPRTVSGYRQAIVRAIERIRNRFSTEDERKQVLQWSPHHLRHTAATELRQRYAPDQVQLLLGHRSLSTTEVYAHADAAVAARIAEEWG